MSRFEKAMMFGILFSIESRVMDSSSVGGAVLAIIALVYFVIAVRFGLSRDEGAE